jgi:hypothetical protein
MFDRGLHDALSLGPDDQIVGFLCLGTAVIAPSEPNDGDPSRFVRFV